ncbi:MAG: LacI family DNA-binding transcriptional regulator [Opitutales bacterium]
MSKRIVLKDVAEAAGVSVATASRALANSTLLKTDTVERVRRIADELGYRPDPGLSSLAAYRGATRDRKQYATIAYLNYWHHDDEWPEFAQDFYEGARQQAAKFGWKLESYPLARTVESQRALSRTLYNRNIRGVIVSSLPRDGWHVELQWEQFAAVASGFTLEVPKLHGVAYSQHATVWESFEVLHKRGCRQIAYVSELVYEERHQYRGFGGAVGYQQAHKLPSLTYILSKSEKPEMLNRWLVRKRVDSIVGDSDFFIDGLKTIANELPADFKVVSPVFHPKHPHIAGVAQRLDRAGANAVDQVISMIHRNEFGIPESPHVTRVVGEFQDGPSARDGWRIDAAAPARND